MKTPVWIYGQQVRQLLPILLYSQQLRTTTLKGLSQWVVLSRFIVQNRDRVFHSSGQFLEEKEK